MPVGDGGPVVDAGPAHGVRADADARGADRVEVDDRGEVVDVLAEEVVPAGRVGSERPGERRAVHPGQSLDEVGVGAVLHRPGDVAAGRAAVRRVVLEAAVAGRVVAGGDHDAVGQARGLAPVGPQDGVADRRGGRVAVGVVDQDGDVVGGEHLQCGDPGRLGQPVGVAADEQRPVVPLALAVLHDRLGGGQDVRLVERAVQAGPAVAAGAEHDLLVGVGRVGPGRVVGRDQVRDVDEVRRLGRGAGALVAHGVILAPGALPRRPGGLSPTRSARWSPRGAAPCTAPRCREAGPTARRSAARSCPGRRRSARAQASAGCRRPWAAW
ncbi:unannotated protein [freshwater metagenome]|uniref:Unannotated protein n=1 Tax=freshwater metagenome TaxID=449393 RepID=A0A6J7GDZ2_9ZZZZ